MIRAARVLRLYSINRNPKHRSGNSVIFCRLKSLPETLNSVWTTSAQFPKLDVAGSNPVSRSIFQQLSVTVSTLYSVVLH